MVCRICSSPQLIEFLDLGPQPWCNHFLREEEVGTEPYYPLKVVFCQNCSAVQINYTVPKEVMFSEHPYVSDRRIVREEDVQRNIGNLNLKAEDLVIDIGGNDGTLLDYYKKQGINKVLNVESAHNIADLSRSKGIETITEFFNETVAKKIESKYDKAKVISAANVFYHVEELHPITKGIKNLLREDGTFIVQFIYLPDMLRNTAFDMIYHEHLLYYTIRSLNALLSLYDLEIYDLFHIDAQGGSIIAYAGHRNANAIRKSVQDYLAEEKKLKLATIEPYESFARRVLSLRRDSVAKIREIKKTGKTIAAYGAPAKGNTLLNFFQLTNKELDFAVEINWFKVNQFTPGSNLRIYHETQVNPPDYYLLMPWHLVDTIVKKERNFLANGGKFLVLIPEVRIVGESE